MIPNRKYFFLFLVVVFLFSVPISFSQSQDQTVMNTSVKLAPNIFVSVYTDKSSYCPPEIVNITTKLENRGNLATTGNLTTMIYDPYWHEFMNGSWGSILLNPTDIKYFNLSHTVTEGDTAGVYTVESNFTYNGEYKYSETTFRIKQGIGTLVASPSKIEETALPGDTIVKKIYFWLVYPCHGTYVYFNATPGPPGSWVIFSENPIWLPIKSWNMTVVYIYVDLPPNTTAGDYTGYIHAYAENQDVVIPLIIHVQPAPIFDVVTEVLPQYKEVCIGSDVTAKVTITKVFPPETVDVNMTYKIESNTTVYDMKQETIAITTSTERYPTLHVPSIISEGYYTFSATLEYQNTSVYSSDIFLAKYCPVYVPPSGYAPPPPIKPPPTFPLILTLSNYRLNAIIGNTTGFVAHVKNIGEKTARAVRLEISGVPIEWISLAPYRSNILINETKDYVVTINVPDDAKEGIYYLNVKATDEYRSEEKTVALIVAKDLKSLAELLFQQLEKTRSVANRTLFLSCLDIKDIIKAFNDAESVREMGIQEYNKGNYKNAINFYDYALSSYEKIIQEADTLMSLEIEKPKPFIFSPFIESYLEDYTRLQACVDGKNYKDFCKYRDDIQRLSFYSTVTVILLVLIIATSVIILILAYRRRKEFYIAITLRRIRERLKGGY